MTKKELKALFERYQAGLCNVEDMALLESWYLEYHKGDWFDIPDEERDKDVDLIWAKIQNNIRQPKRVYLWYRIAAAASLFLVLLFGLIYYSHQNKHIEQVSVNKSDDVSPGGNKAILTLAGGQQIILTDAKNGKLGQQGATTIHKTSAGQVVYTVDGAEATSRDMEIVYNMITTPRGGQYHLTLADGTNVWLNAASSIKYPTAFSGDDRKVEMTGEAYFEVAHNKDKPFFVTSNGQTVEVLGTHFNINAYSDEPSIKTTLFEGAVKVRRGTVFALLKPGQQSIVIDKDNNSSITVSDRVDMEQALAWKNGKFNFDKADVKTVMRQLSRWYDVDVEYTREIPQGHFSGAFSRNMNASKALNLLEYTGVNFKIEGRKIIVK